MSQSRTSLDGKPGFNSSRGQGCQIQDFYDVGSRLTADACGAGGEVMRGVHKADGQSFAVKVIQLDKTREDRSQIQTLGEVNHPGIIKLVDWFETPATLYVVMELALGGEMFGRIAERRAYTERDAAACFKQVLEAVGHMHNRGIVHCDLKPENVLYEDDTDRQIKIADFGFAQFMPGGSEGGEKLSKQLGTLSYTAPEILAGTGYDTKADMWSLGVILYILLSGIPPFGKRRGETDRDVKRNILKGAYRFYESHWKDVSALAVDLVKKLIVVNPKDRLSWEQAIEHPWIQGNAPDAPLGGEYIVELGQFNARRGMYKLASHALAGLVSRFAQPDAIAAISADTSSLSRVLQEGSIQPLISLAYSKSPDDRKNACNAMANLALQEEYQPKLVYEGGIRRLNQLACKDAQSNDIKFFVALALARVARNPDLREPLLDPSVNNDPKVNTQTALMVLSEPPPANPSRAQRQAVEALAMLCSEERLHKQLVEGNVLPALVRQAHPEQPTEFRKTALQALVNIAAAAMSKPLPQGAVSLEQINKVLSGLFDSALEAKDDVVVGKQAMEVIGGLSSTVCILKAEGLIVEMVEEGDEQSWHSAVDIFPQVKLPDIDSKKFSIPVMSKTPSQIYTSIDLTPIRKHLLEAHTMLHEVTGHPLPLQSATWLDRHSLLGKDLPDTDTTDEMDVAFESLELADQTKAKLTAIHDTLTKDRGSLLEIILSTSKGSRGNIPDAMQHVLNELTDVILMLSDTLHSQPSP
mmetsp:Transcript_39717/g.97625  ORF Transcript_39717/g.97625 Transcript_39717/m.97625 type:complete len:754 (-) Transcript_39717:484-2745(-)